MTRKGQFARGSNLFLNPDSNLIAEPQDLRRRRRILMQACDHAYRIEALESRVLLAADLWTGAGGNSNWTTGANWASGVAPRPGDDLIFPTGAAQTTNNNDFAAGTSFNSIMLRGSGYAITGNAIALTNGIVASNASGAGNADNINLPITLAASQTILDANAGATLSLNGTIDTGSFLNLTFDGSGATVVNSTVSDNGNIIKNGAGTVTLAGSNTYNGTTTINQGALLITNSTALGNSADTIVNAGAALEASGNITVNAPLSLSGFGVGIGVDASGNGGALRVIGSGSTVTWSGGIGLSTAQGNGADVFIGVDAGNTLNISGVVNSIQVGSATLAKVGAGTLQFSGSSSNTYTGTTTVLGGLLQLNKTGGAVAIPGSLIIGDQRNPIAGDATTGPAAYNGGFTATTSGAIVQLMGNNQIAPVDFWAVNLLTDTIFPSGELDLNGFNDTMGNITMWQGPAYSAKITTANDNTPSSVGVLSLEGTSITVSASEGTSGQSPSNPNGSPPVTIAGQLDLSTLFSGGGAGQRASGNITSSASPPRRSPPSKAPTWPFPPPSAAQPRRAGKRPARATSASLETTPTPARPC